MRLSLALIALSAALPVNAQSTAPQGNPAPNASIATSRPDGSSILPGERGGVPQGASGDARRPQQCRDLPAAMRDECLSPRRADPGVGVVQAPERGGSSLPPAPPQQR